MKTLKGLLIFIVLVCVFIGIGCGKKGGDSATGPDVSNPGGGNGNGNGNGGGGTVVPTTPILISVELTLGTTSLEVGGTTTANAVAKYSDGSTKAITATSDNTGIVDVNGNSVVAKAPGTANLVASEGGKSASATLVVKSPAPVLPTLKATYAVILYQGKRGSGKKVMDFDIAGSNITIDPSNNVSFEYRGDKYTGTAGIVNNIVVTMSGEFGGAGGSFYWDAIPKN